MLKNMSCVIVELLSMLYFYGYLQANGLMLLAI
jgi:hypothetical protein